MRHISASPGFAVLAAGPGIISASCMMFFEVFRVWIARRGVGQRCRQIKYICQIYQ